MDRLTVKQKRKLRKDKINKKANIIVICVLSLYGFSCVMMGQADGLITATFFLICACTAYNTRNGYRYGKCRRIKRERKRRSINR